MYYGAPFEPTDRDALNRMIRLSRVRKGDKVADLGSGDGRVVTEFAKIPRVKEAHGFEINPFLVVVSKMRIKKLGLEKKAFIHWKNMWGQNYREFDVISVFQISYIMERLGKKLKREMKKGSRIVSNVWKFPNLKLKKSENNVHLYRV
jgi:protein-L-isoaspartate O-methyltransferase